MQTTIKIADIVIQVNHSYATLRQYCGDYVSSSDVADFDVEVTERDIDAEREKSKAECAFENIPYPDFRPDELELTATYRKIANKITEYDAFVFHGSAVAVNGNAFLFTARSGTGKTTHTNLWLKNISGSFIVNGDKPIIRITDGKAYVYGTPWAGKELLQRNVRAELKAICILDRGIRNEIHAVSFSEAMPMLFQQAYRPREKTKLLKTMSLIEKLGKLVGLYSLHCNISDEAALLSYKTMTETDK